MYGRRMLRCLVVVRCLANWGLLIEDERLKMRRQILNGDEALLISNMFLLSAAFERASQSPFVTATLLAHDVWTPLSPLPPHLGDPKH